MKALMSRIDIPELAKEYIPPLVVLFLAFAFQDQIATIFNKTLLPFLNHVESGAYTNGIYIAILVCCLIWIVWACRHNYHIHAKIWFSVLIAVLYYFYIHHKYYVSVPKLFGIGYADGLVVMAGLMFIIPGILSSYRNIQRYYRNKKSKDSSEIEDETDNRDFIIVDKPIENPDDDALDYYRFAERIAGDIIKDVRPDSYSIGILGQWGSGKSSFLNLLKSHIKKNKAFLVLEFNPSNSKTAELIQEDFFSQLYSELAHYDYRFSSVIKSYLEAVNIVDVHPVMKILSKTHNLWNGSDKKQMLEKSIQRRWIKVIVIIDDFDRLLRPEIIEVFKLINGTANFKNFVFITAFDKSKVNKLLSDITENSESTYQSSCYSDKFFNHEIHLPVRPYRMILNYLIKAFRTKIFYNTDIDVSQFLLDKESEFEQCVHTLRDAKRFINQYGIGYSLVAGEVDDDDYLLLSLIKYRYPEEYYQLAALHSSADVIDIPYSTGEIKKLKEKFLNFQSKDILSQLFLKDKPSFRSICVPIAYQIYFNESIYDHLTVKRMSVILDPNGPWESLLFDLTDKNEALDIYGYLSSVNPWGLESKERFEHFLKVLILFSCNSWYARETSIMIYGYFTKETKDVAISRFGYAEEVYRKIMLRNLEGIYNYIPNGLIRELLLSNLNAGTSIPNAPIVSHDEILQVAKSNFEKILASESNSGLKVYDTLLSCIDKVEEGSHKVILNKDACKLMRERIEKCPDAYFSTFVRLLMVSSNPQINSITCEPYWEQIFGDSSKVRALIDNQLVEISKRSTVQNFWKMYEANGFQPIGFDNDGDVQQKINSGLVNEVRIFDDAMNIKRKFDELKSRYKANEISAQDYKKDISDLNEQINKINLNIRSINLLRVEVTKESERL